MSNTNEKTSAVLDQDLYQAIRDGNLDAGIARLKKMPIAKRRDQAEALRLALSLMNWSHWDYSDRSKKWGSKSSPEQYQVLKMALLACGTQEDIWDLGLYVYISRNVVLTHGELHEWSSSFDIDQESWRKRFEQVVEAEIERFPSQNYLRIHGFIVVGMIERPQYESYLLNLVNLPGINFQTLPNGIFDILVEDKELPSIILQLFDLEGTGESNLASSEKYTSPGNKNVWSNVFLTLCEQGIYTRDLLLDKTLTTLERDWPQFRSGWFSRFHEALAPTSSEMAAYAERYLGLCQSRIPPTVTLALAALKKLHDDKAIDDATLVAGIQPAFYSAIKAQINTALKLLDAIVKREPTLKHEASAVAANGLTHEAAEVQQKIIERLQKWGVSEETRSALSGFAQGVAAVNRPALQKLAGDEACAAPAIAVEAEVKAEVDAGSPVPLPSVLDESRRLAVFSTVDELIESAAFVLENPQQIDMMERVIAGLQQRAPFDTALCKAFSPVTKRANKLVTHANMTSALARLLVFLTTGERLPPREYYPDHLMIEELFVQRIERLMDTIAKGTPLAPLDHPTHQRGFIDPQCLIERLAAYQTKKREPAPEEQIQALLRLAPVREQALIESARKLADTPMTRALRHALGDEVDIGPEKALFIAAARIRHPDADDEKVLAAYGDLGPDAAKAARYEWSAHTWQSDDGEYTYHGLSMVSDILLPDTPHEFLSVIRHPLPPKTPYFDSYELHPGAESDEVAYSATLLPSSLEAFFAIGSRCLENNLRWSEANWHHKDYVTPLLDPTVPMTPMANLLLAITLASKEPGLVATGVDALVAASADRRLDIEAFGTTMHDLLVTPLVMAKRYAKSLQSAARMHPEMPGVVFNVLCRMVRIEREEPIPKDLAALLELLQELMLTYGLEMPQATRQALAELKLTGKGKTAIKSLLG